VANKNILLIEPGYKNKYPPLGLMKIAQYHGPNGKNDNVTFVKGEEDKKVLEQSWDRIYVTSLFSFEWKKTARTIDYALQVANNQASKVFVGGIAASLMHDAFLAESQWRGIRFIKGLLTDAPATSLQLDDFAEELYSNDISGTPIEDLVPDYNILDQIDYSYSVIDAYFLYASRGCIRKCKFCGVPKLEGPQRDSGSITDIVQNIEALYGTKRDMILMDNNVVASSRYKEIINEIVDLGFEKDARIKNSTGKLVQRRVDFNQGIDARILCKDEMFLREMSRICIKPLRIAFDHLGVSKPYIKSIEYANNFGLTSLSNYMLYNFHDSPEDLYQRMKINIDLNLKLGVRIFSFPMRYQPTDLKDRSHVGPRWNRYFLRSMQIILQATHGIVSGAPDFFNQAFGQTEDDYIRLLMYPQHFLFNREWYQRYGGADELLEYENRFKKLTIDERYELMELLSPLGPSQYINAVKGVKNKKLHSVIGFYQPLDDEVERKIWIESKRLRKNKYQPISEIAVDELVEDAGLEEVA